MKNNPDIFIVEDEPLICATIETALRKQGFKVLGDTDNYNDAIKAIDTFSPDLVLVDIQLEGRKDGIDLAAHLDSNSIPYIFLTSQTDPETIERVKRINPLGYIVKPFTESSLRSNIELAWHNFSLTNTDYYVIKHEGRSHKLNQNDILYLKAFDNYCYINTRNAQYLVPHTLKHASESLNNTYFFRVHRSYVVNLKHITSFDRKSVYLGHVSIPLSNSHRSDLKRALNP